MNQFVRLILWPALAGMVIALVILQFFPDHLTTRPQEPAKTPAIPATAMTGPVSYASAVDKAAPAVVNIYTTKIVQRKRHPLFDDPFFQQFFGNNRIPQQRMQSSLGSGVIIDPTGYVLTNNHVIANADEIVVALQDGREGLAKVVGTDPETDLAVLKIELGDLPTISVAPSDEVAVGDVVLAIGNPFGVGQTVTMGIVSATGRNQLGLTTFEDFLQTDAAINPGNSGGALINAYGDLIGINTAIFSKSGGSQGIGFAIPSELAGQILHDIIVNGSVIRGWLGIEVQPLTPELAESFGLDRAIGVLVAGVHRNGPAYIAGVRPGDILLQVEGEPVVSGRQAMNQITQTQPGNQVALELLRDGKLLQIEATIARRVPNGQGAAQ